ncbi:pyridoxal-dependent decarboxylase [Burkholderia gladioli]|uniref:Pyridoxal-dependent decarboxylase n=1 Tax=Burkholderia gladioli TaxID=28095 RepID=A0A2A7S5E6_BURGA|nr:pyridoxal-dependent decarboxylase [Burkholderia gladioli pv. gladioli]PEH38692.1 pyridoxal-dependent decarboxylase [Burkholderia gladioli]PRE78819.1 pyridoxal-dependent decarboxylase [Burkholderia gladioli]
MVDVGDDGDIAKGAGHRNLKSKPDDRTRKNARGWSCLTRAAAYCILESLEL